MARPSKSGASCVVGRVRLVSESKADYSGESEAIRSIAAKLGITLAETLRNCVRHRRR